MGHKVTKPSQRKYWVARTPSDDIIHVGFLEPNQELVTPQHLLENHQHITIDIMRLVGCGNLLMMKHNTYLSLKV